MYLVGHSREKLEWRYLCEVCFCTRCKKVKECYERYSCCEDCRRWIGDKILVKLQFEGNSESAIQKNERKDSLREDFNTGMILRGHYFLKWE